LKKTSNFVYKYFFMSLTIQLPSSLEQQIRDNAVRQGISLEKLIAQMLVSGINRSEVPDEKNIKEADLLQRIRLTTLPEAELSEYYRLSVLRQAEQLHENEYERLVSLTHRVEAIHAERLKYVAELAALQGLPLRQVMHDLGLSRTES
jgi:iron-sulfur cluster repair protein YtfE (RIC family)